MQISPNYFDLLLSLAVIGGNEEDKINKHLTRPMIVTYFLK